MRKVLLVEDDNFQIIVVRHIFDKHFPAVDLRIANNGSEALAHLKETHFDLIILDLGLPDMDGTEVISHVNATSKTPIVVLTADDSEDRIREVRLLDVVEYVIKHVELNTFVTLIRSILIDFK